MSRSTIIVVIIMVLACLWFGTVFSTCAPGGRASGLGWGLPIFIGGGGGWDRGGWDRSGSPSPSSPGRGSGGGLQGGGISGGRGGK